MWIGSEQCNSGAQLPSSYIRCDGSGKQAVKAVYEDSTLRFYSGDYHDLGQFEDRYMILSLLLSLCAIRLTRRRFFMKQRRN